jgi:plastocyanin
MLATPGQSIDVPVTMGVGEYTFQCDPHAMMGMKGTLTVQ